MAYIARVGNCVSFPLTTDLGIYINTVIDDIWNTSGLNVECGISVSCNCVIPFGNSTKVATYFGLKRNPLITVKIMCFRYIRVSLSLQMED